MELKVIVKDQSPIRKELEVSLAASDLKQALVEAYEEIGKKAKIKGFRPGKIPQAVLEQYYRSDAESDAMKHLVQESYPEAVRHAGLVPVSSPEISVTKFDANEGVVYSAVFEVPPQIDVKNYRDLELKQEKKDVSDAEVETQLKGLQERLAQLLPVTEDRKVLPSDVILFDYQAYQGPSPLIGFKGENLWAELGQGKLFPELEKGFLEMKVGEKKKVGVSLPSEWPDPKLAGSFVDYEISLKEVKQKKVPDLNDDFAKDLGPFQTLQEVRDRIRQDLIQAQEQNNRHQLRRQIIEHLIRQNEFAVPEALVQMELDDMKRNFEHYLQSQGVKWEQTGVTEEEFYSKNKDEAVFRVRGALLFDAVARKENIAVTEEELDHRIEEMAKRVNQPTAVWKKQLQQNHLLGRIEALAMEEKALDFVLSHSKIK